MASQTSDTLRINMSLLITVVLGSCIAYSGLFTMPLWIGAVADQHKLDASLPAYMGSLQLIFAVLSSLFLSRKLDVFNARYVHLAGISIVIAANVFSAFAPSLSFLFLARALSGLGEGLLLANLNALICRTENPDRMFALSQTTIALFGITLFLTVPSLIGLYAAGGVFGFVCIVGLIALIATVFFPRLSSTGGSETDSQDSPSGRFLLPLTALGILFIGCQGSWTFLERMGIAKGFELQNIGYFLTIGQGIGLLGPICAAFVSRKIGRPIAIVIGLVISGSAVMLASQPVADFFYVFSAGAFQFATLFIVTSYLSHLAQLDPSGKAVAAAPAFINLGSAAGPALMGVTLTAGGYPAVGWAVIVSYFIAALLVLKTPHSK